MDINSNELNISNNENISEKKKNGLKKGSSNPQNNQPQSSNNIGRNTLLIVIIPLIVIVVVVVLYVVVLKKKSKKTSPSEPETESSPVEKPEPEKEPETEIEEFFISASYNAKRRVPLKIFNPSRIGLTDQNYTIKEFTTKNNRRRRRLQELNVTDGVIIPEITGIIEINIIFKVNLSSLDFLFEGCTDLIKINLSKINSSLIKSMIYTFTDCSSLKTVDLTSFDSSGIQKMEFLFGGCTNLENIKGFEKLNTSSLEKTAGMFIGCENLQSVNLSSFQLDNISEANGMFINNPSLVTLDIGNSSDINGFLSSSENYKINIITTSNEVNTSGLTGQFTRVSRVDANCTKRNWTNFIEKYINDEEMYELYKIYPEYYFQIVNNSNNFSFNQEIYDNLKQIKYIDCNSPNNSLIYYNFYINFFGKYNSSKCEKYKRFFIDLLNEFEKCVECDTEEGRRVNCKTCSKGYYVPNGIDFDPKKCRRCDEGCMECISGNETDESICLNCEDNNNKYMLYNGKCIKKCITGNGEKCKNCNKDDGKYDQCLTCNDGYYFDENIDSSKCQKINIENCSEAVVESGTVRCTNCSNGYIVHDNQCVKACNFGYWGDSCASCNRTYEFRENCESCYSGYYLAFSEKKTICKNCNLDALFYYNSNNCKECEYISGEVRCTECGLDSVLVNGKCIASCSFACKNCSYENEKYVCKKCIDGYFLKEYEDGKICVNCSDGCKTCSSENTCTQCMPGYKIVYPNQTTVVNDIPTNISTYPETIYEIYSYLINHFNNSFQFKLASNITKLDAQRKLSNDATKKTVPNINLNKSQTTILRKLDNNNSNIISNEESHCEKICTIGPYENCKSCDLNGKDKCRDCNPGYYLPNNTIVKSQCYNCGSNCLSCYGSLYNPICIECNPGYYAPIGYYRSDCYYCGSYGIKKCHQDNNYNIIIDECISNYILARNQCFEKCDSTRFWSRCLECNEEPDKLHECKKCKDGMYLPTDYDNTYCYYCPYPCKSCEGTSYNPTCLSCLDGYELSGGRCLKNCTKGKNEKCKSCNLEPGKIDRCLDCNEGYYLPDDDYYDYYYNYYYYNFYNNYKGKCSRCSANCKKCNGKYGYNPDCIQCETGYYLVEKEENEYSYYYNQNFYHICAKCNMKGCKIYKPNSNSCICIECDTPIIQQVKNNSTDNEIISCYGGCEIGELDKCKSCSNEGGKCGECNDGFILNTEGKCTPEDFHMFAKYRTTQENEYVELMYPTTIIKMVINGTRIHNPKYYYTFKLPGEHSVYIKFSGYISFMDLFYRITHLTYIAFLPKAKSFSINYMNDCFCGCINLEYADLSNLYLKNNKCFMNFFKGDKKLKEVKFPSESFSNIYWYYRMFYGCESLTSIDMSNIHNTNGQYFYEMFYGCTKLKSINLGGFNKAYNGYYNYGMFVNVPKDAEIIIHKNFFNGISNQLINFNNIKSP